MTPKQIFMARGLLANAGLTDEDKKLIVLSHTGNRTESLTECNKEESAEVMRYLLNYNKIEQSPADKMRGKILSLAHDMHWTKNKKADIDRVNNWCVKYSGFKLPLRHIPGKGLPDGQIADADLPKVVTAFQKMVDSYLNGF
jgi:hypothetical protein